MATDAAAVQIPGKAISQDGDVRAPVVDLLQSLNLLGKSEKDGQGFVTAFTGPPQSVAVIESGVTAATKWWATGIGATLIATWGRLLTWWGGQALGVKEVALGGAFFVTAAAIGAIGYLFASDVRGRATASAATIAAREHVALAMIDAAEAASKNGAAAVDEDGRRWIQLSPPLSVHNYAAKGHDEEGWKAIALGVAPHDGKREYLVVKGSDEVVLDHSQLGFD